MPLPSCPRVPPLTPVCLCKGRIESTYKIAKRLAVHTLNAPLPSTEEDPRMLTHIPEQRSFLILLLVVLAA
jgi:hypothetical protein